MWNWIWISNGLCIADIAHKPWLNCVWFLVLIQFFTFPKKILTQALAFLLLPSVSCIHSFLKPFLGFRSSIICLLPDLSMAFGVRKQRCKRDRIRVLVTLEMGVLCCQTHQAVAWSFWGWFHSLASLWNVMWIRVELVARHHNQGHGIFNERRICKKMKQIWLLHVCLPRNIPSKC